MVFGTGLGGLPKIEELLEDPKLKEEGFTIRARISSLNPGYELDYILKVDSQNSVYDISEYRLILRKGQYDVYVRKKPTND